MKISLSLLILRRLDCGVVSMFVTIFKSCELVAFYTHSTCNDDCTSQACNQFGLHASDMQPGYASWYASPNFLLGMWIQPVFHRHFHARN